LKELSTLGDTVIAETLKRISPLAWQHINFYGRYQFNSDTPPVNTTEIAKKLAALRHSGPQ